MTVQSTVKLGLDSAPEPELAVFAGSARYCIGKPLPRAELVVEVAVSSVEFDRGVKSKLYSQANIPEYWLIGPNYPTVLVFRQPTADGYRECVVSQKDHQISPLIAPASSVNISNLLP